MLKGKNKIKAILEVIIAFFISFLRNFLDFLTPLKQDLIILYLNTEPGVS